MPNIGLIFPSVAKTLLALATNDSPASAISLTTRAPKGFHRFQYQGQAFLPGVTAVLASCAGAGIAGGLILSHVQKSAPGNPRTSVSGVCAWFAVEGRSPRTFLRWLTICSARLAMRLRSSGVVP
jgi:hypothetical protein